MVYEWPCLWLPHARFLADLGYSAGVYPPLIFLPILGELGHGVHWGMAYIRKK